MELLSTPVAVAFSSCVCPLTRMRPEVRDFMVREFPYMRTEDNKVRLLSNSSCNQGINSELRLGCSEAHANGDDVEYLHSSGSL